MLKPVRVAPLAQERVWGGVRFPPLRSLPIGELWLAGPSVPAAMGLYAGRILDEIAAELGEAFVGSAAPQRGGPRFPLLVKLLDPAGWLSVQVHPDDVLAVRLEGAGAVGKTEAWYVLEAGPDSEVLVGVRPGVTLDDARAAIALPPEARGSAVVDLMERVSTRPGVTILVRAGTLHAVGPGALLYELQQPSDLTYRVDDWGRPASAARPLHQAQALAAVAVEPVLVLGPDAPAPVDDSGQVRQLVACEQFVLDRVDGPVRLDPAGRTLHVVTAVGGAVRLAGDGWREDLAPLDTIVMPAAGGAYDIAPGAGARALVARLP